ncbi:MAG: PEP-CTERM sorting domain-containing protein, partial [Patescibacteria group bacterium]|nr:PEP-CTERM sorting domain-containing protein [Patescibacteria group bacterium]
AEAIELTTAADGLHTVQIDDGVTLRVFGSFGVSPDKSLIFGNFTADGTTRTAFTGNGTLLVDSPTKDFWVGGRAGASASAESSFTIDMSALANFEANVDEFRIVAGSLRSKADVTLAGTNSITANAVVVGSNSYTASTGESLRLGQTNVMNANTLVVAGARSTAILAFDSDLTGTPTLVLRGKAGGSSRANVWIGDQNGDSGYGTGGTSTAVGTVDLTAGSVDAMIGNLIVARNGTYYSGRAGAANGALSFAAGTIDATQIVLGRTPAINEQLANFNDPLNTGTLNMLGGTLVAGSMILGEVQGNGAADSSATSPSMRAAGVFNLSGGTAIVNGGILLGNHTKTGTADAIGTINFSGGTLQAQQIAPGGGTNNVSTFNWTGGTLHVNTFGLDLVQNGGTLAPGTSIGTTHVVGDYTQNAGLLEIEIQSPGLTAGVDYDLVEVDGAAMLDGSLVVSLLDDYVPEIGSVFDVLTADTITLGSNFSLIADENFVTRLYSGSNGDVFQLRYVPEPSSLALLLLLALGLLAGRNRARHRAA